MKTFLLIACAMTAALGLTSCDPDGLYVTTPYKIGAFKPMLPPVAGPIYTPPGRAYRNSSFYIDQDVSYQRLPSLYGASHYVCYDSVQPQPIPLPQKSKTWRYTSRYPAAWGAPVFLTTYKPAPARTASPPPPLATPY